MAKAYMAPQQDCEQAFLRCVGRRQKQLGCSWEDAFKTLVQESKGDVDSNNQIREYLDENFGINQQTAEKVIESRSEL